MTPKEKAKKLVDNFFIQEIKYYGNKNTAKQCALIAVDELVFYCSNLEMYYWQQVKDELQKL